MKAKKILNTASDSEVDISMDDFQKELIEENNFLMKLVDSIPAKMYFDQEIQEKLTANKHLAMDKAAEALKGKSQPSAKEKHKRSRLDPSNQKSVSQIQQEMSVKKEKKIKQKGLLVPSASITRAANIEELQKRLQERINLLQAQRKAAGKDSVAKKRLKAKMKKLKRNRGNLKKVEESKKAEETPAKPKGGAPNDKPVFNKEGTFIYSKFNFSKDGQEDKKKSEYEGKKIKTLLKKAEKKKEKMENLKNVDPEKAKLVEEKEKWKKAIQKSEGIKVKDDPNLLKKSLKSEEKKKKKSAKAWKGRIEETDKRKKARQEKRNKNIMTRKKEKLDRKLKLAKKKGRVIPGF